MTRSWLNARKALDMSPTDAAWLAGFFDGEGSLTRHMTGRGGTSVAWALTLGNTFFASLDRCIEITGVGSLRPKIRRDPKHSPCKVWQVSAQRDVAAIVRQMLPYLTIKRAKAEQFLAEWRDLP